jgi:PAS domain S-box-containing protein
MADGLEDLKALWQELKAHVDRLADERQHYLEIFEQAEDAYLVTNPDGAIERANGAAVDLFERRRRYLRGKPLAALIAPDWRRDFRRQYANLVNGSAAAASWRTVLGNPLRTQVLVNARVMGQPERGVGWVLRPAQ